MILSPVKSQPFGITVTDILLKSSCNKYLKHFNPYIFILQKVKKPPYRFFTYLFFASSTNLIFGGLFYIGYPGYSNSSSIV